MKVISKRAFVIAATLCLFSFTGCKMNVNSEFSDAGKQAAPVAADPIANIATAPAAAVAALAAAIDIDTAAPSPLNVAVLPTKGNPNAKVTLVEFSDYECPFCSRVEPTVKTLLETYPNDIRVAFVNMPLPFHKNARPAAKAAVAALKLGGVDAYWKMHDKLFANQKSLNDAFYKATAAEIGLDAAAFEAAMNSPEVDSYINKGVAEAQKAGLGGTPSFLINGVQFVGAQPVDNFKKVIDEQIKRADEVAAAKNLSGQALYEELVKTAPKPPAPQDEDEDQGRRLVDLTGAPVYGDVNAPVTIVEFTDFECPYCSRANTTIHELLEKNPGKAKLVFRAYPLPFHKNAKLAHQAAEAAKLQGKFWDYYDKLFANQKALDRDSLIKYAEELDLNKEKFIADLDSEAVIKAVENDAKMGTAAGVNGTPHFLLNGRILSGAQPLPAFQAALDEEVRLAEAELKKGTPLDQVYPNLVKANAKPEPAPIVVDIAGSPFKGAANAPVTIVQFSEFQCPFCKRVEPTLDQLMENPKYAGKLKIVFKQKPLPFHDKAQKAAEAALGVLAIAGQDAFWKFHKSAFEHQPALAVDELLKYAKDDAGLTDAQVETLKADLESNKYAAAVKADVDAAEAVKIGGTPSFIINGKLFVGAQPIDRFEAVIDEALANAEAK